MPKAMDLTGQKFGFLTVISLSKNRDNKVRKWVCECECGNVINVRVADLTSGNTKSCGCYQRKKAKEVKQSHGGCGKRLYRIWCNMKSRCLNSNTPAFKNYGGRGITVCQEWVASYANFESWAMANGYKNDLTLERKDANRNYEPLNCTFIPKSKQSSNTRRCRFVCYKRETKTLSEWSRELHFGRNSFRNHRSEFDTDEETINYLLSKHKS